MTYQTGTWGIQAKEKSRRRLEYFKEYRRKHTQTQYYLLNKERIRKNAAIWYQENKDKALDRISGYRNKWRIEMLQVMGGKCIKCGFTDWRALQIDHVNGGGNKEGRRVGPSFYKRVKESYLKNENKYQLLCANCNFIKRYENNELQRRKGGELN